MDYIVVRTCRRGGYELVDPLGKYMGCAPTLLHAYRVAEAEGDPLILEIDLETDGEERWSRGPTWLRALAAWLREPVAFS